MKLSLVFAPLLGSAPCGCSSSPPAAAAPSSEGLPSADALCKLRPGQSTVQDALALLGHPVHRETFPDGSSFLDSAQLPSSQVVDLHLAFTSQQLVSDATTLNIPEPTCWIFDAGSPESE
jgi:hypothetical protein